MNSGIYVFVLIHLNKLRVFSIGQNNQKQPKIYYLLTDSSYEKSSLDLQIQLVNISIGQKAAEMFAILSDQIVDNKSIISLTICEKQVCRLNIYRRTPESCFTMFPLIVGVHSRRCSRMELVLCNSVYSLMTEPIITD